jgi:hypothetical protein
MRRYPIGSFLIWKVDPETASSYAFYDFLTDYHMRDHPYASKAVVPAGQGVLAILDGQQRLTALNIAVYGSLAVKRKYAWWNSTDAFPRKRLYLNILADADPSNCQDLWIKIVRPLGAGSPHRAARSACRR